MCNSTTSFLAFVVRNCPPTAGQTATEEMMTYLF